MVTTDTIEIPKLIKEIRIALILTQEELARILDVNFITISRWERGLHTPRARDLRALLRLAKKHGLDKATDSTLHNIYIQLSKLVDVLRG